MPLDCVIMVPIAKIADEKVIAVVSGGSRDAWIGFKNVPQAIRFKAEETLGEDWRIRDRRELHPTDVQCHEKPQVLRDAMLIIGSMIQDHVLPFLAQAAAVKLSALERREITMFAATLLKEISIGTDRDFGRWRAVRGKRVLRGLETSTVWLADVHGNILDLTPVDRTTTPVAWHDSGSNGAGQYFGVSMLGTGYGSALGGAFRGETRSAGADAGQDAYARYERLVTHIEMFISRSLLPTRDVGAAKDLW